MKENRRNVTIAMMIATFLAAIEVTIVSTAMPTIVSDLGGVKLISWVYAVYLLTSAVTTPIYGKLTDLFGRKKIFVIGAIIFLLGSILSGLSQNMLQLIWFRALQGLGAGAILPTTFTIIGDIYPYEERAKIQGVFSGIWGISGIVGPLVGGFLVDYVSWRWIFYLNLPFGIISIFLVSLFLKETFDKKRKQIDYLGAVTFTIAITSILYALLTGGTTYSWDSFVIIGLFTAGFLFLMLFVLIQTRVPEPMLPLQLFRIPAILFSNLAGFFSSAVLIGINVYVPLWIQGVYGQGATGSGLTLLPISVGWPIGATIGGRLMLKVGPRNTAVVGMIGILLGTFILAMVDMSTPHWVLFASMLIVGLGFGFGTTVLTVVVQSSVGWNMRGVATAANTLLRTLGQTIGVAVFGLLFNQYLSSYITSQGERIPPNALNKMLNPEGVKSLSESVLLLLRKALENSLHHIFLVLTILTLVTFLLVLWIPRSKPEPEGSMTMQPNRG